VEKNLSRLPKMQTASSIDRMHKHTDIKERMYDLSERERFNNTIIEFNYFVKKVLPQLKQMKKQIEQYQGVKTTSIANHKGLYNILFNYESLNLNVYVEHDSGKQVLNSEENRQKFKDQMDTMINQMGNVFVDMYHWCKGEIYDLQALGDAVAGRDHVEKEQRRLEAKKKNTQADLENVN
jgi:hypothetical protein